MPRARCAAWANLVPHSGSTSMAAIHSKVKYVEMSFGKMESALVQGRVAAAALTEPYFSEAKSRRRRGRSYRRHHGCDATTATPYVAVSTGRSIRLASVRASARDPVTTRRCSNDPGSRHRLPRTGCKCREGCNRTDQLRGPFCRSHRATRDPARLHDRFRHDRPWCGRSELSQVRRQLHRSRAMVRDARRGPLPVTERIALLS